MSTALALTSCEAQSIAAAGGQGNKSAAGTAETRDTSDGFKKELADYEAMIIPAQPATTDGSIPNAEAGKQLISGGIQELPGISCVFEGIEMQGSPSDVAEAQSQVTPPNTIPVDGMSGMADGQQADSTPESNARMQQTEAGGAGSTPVKTQDQILETVGAYIDAADETGSAKTGVRMPQVAAQTAAPPQEGSPAEAKAPGGMAITDDAVSITASGESTETNAVQRPAAPVAADTNDSAPVDTRESTALGKSDYAAAGKPENPVMGNAGNPAAGKPQGAAETAGKREPSVTVDAKEQSGKMHSVAAPVTDQKAEPVVKNAPAEAAAQPRAEEAAQYTKENVLRIVDKVSTQAHEGRYDFDVELKPEFLGKVNIKLTMEDGVIRMQIKTDDMSVKGMLTDQASSLQNALKEKGITLSSVDVTYENQASMDGGKQPYEQNDGQRRQGGMYYAQADTGYEPAAEPYSYYVGNSSVEFLA